MACYLIHYADTFPFPSNKLLQFWIKYDQPNSVLLPFYVALAWPLSAEVLYLRPFQDLTRILITVFALLVSACIWMDENTFPAFGHILLHTKKELGYIHLLPKKQTLAVMEERVGYNHAWSYDYHSELVWLLTDYVSSFGKKNLCGQGKLLQFFWWKKHWQAIIRNY